MSNVPAPSYEVSAALGRSPDWLIAGVVRARSDFLALR